MRFAYADPPYPGMAEQYRNHPDFAGEVDHQELIERLVSDYPDGWALSTSERGLQGVLALSPSDVRICSWVHTNPQWHHFGRFGELGYAWEPVIIRTSIRPQGSVVNWHASGWTGKRFGFAGGKPEDFCFWLFRCLGAQPGDELVDLFPGSGAVSRAWDKYQRQMPLPTTREKIPQLALDSPS